jgi:predicted NUDIX family NTP pyrophosphohydrolase
MKAVKFKVEQNAMYGDFRVVKYLNGFWLNERDGNWSKSKAEQKAREYRQLAKKGIRTMGDDC